MYVKLVYEADRVIVSGPGGIFAIVDNDLYRQPTVAEEIFFGDDSPIFVKSFESFTEARTAAGSRAAGNLN